MRRAGERARRERAGGGAQPAARDPAAAGHHADLHRARPERGALLLGRGGGDVSGADYGDRAGRGDLRGALAPLHRVAAGGGARAGPNGAHTPHPAGGEHPEPGQPALGLPLPHALPAPRAAAGWRGDLHAAGAARARGGGRTPDPLPHPAGDITQPGDGGAADRRAGGINHASPGLYDPAPAAGGAGAARGGGAAAAGGKQSQPAAGGGRRQAAAGAGDGGGASGAAGAAGEHERLGAVGLPGAGDGGPGNDASGPAAGGDAARYPRGYSGGADRGGAARAARGGGWSGGWRDHRDGPAGGAAQPAGRDRRRLAGGGARARQDGRVPQAGAADRRARVGDHGHGLRALAEAPWPLGHRGEGAALHPRGAAGGARRAPRPGGGGHPRDARGQGVRADGGRWTVCMGPSTVKFLLCGSSWPFYGIARTGQEIRSTGRSHDILVYTSVCLFLS